MLKKRLKTFLPEVKKQPLFFLIIFVLILVRFFWLDKNPVNLSHDEVEYYINSLSYWQTGSDLSGYTFPLSLIRTQTSGIISAVPSLILSPYYAMSGMNIFSVRVPHIILNIITTLLIYLFVYKLTKDKLMAFVSLFLFLISPWSVFLSRWAADTPFALFFYLLSLCLLLSKNRYKFQLSFVSLILGFFSYHGAKPLFIPLSVIVSVYQYLTEKTKPNAKKTVLFIVGVLVFFAGYLLAEVNIQGTPGSGRFTDIAFMDKGNISFYVNEERRMQIENPLKNITSNKLTSSFAIMIEKYFNSFSPDTLFIAGDPRATYRFGSYGLLHLYDFIFIPLGLMYLYRKNRKVVLFLSLVALVAPITTALSIIDTSVVHRSFFLLPVLVIFSAAGFVSLSELLKNKKLVWPMIGVITLPFYFYFMHFYFFRTPIINQENYFLSEKVLAKYLTYIDDESEYQVIDTDPREVYLQFLFESGNKNLNSAMDKERFIDEIYQTGNIEFVDYCPEYFKEDVNYIASRRMGCFSQIIPEAAILDQKDAGGIFRIQRDTVCGHIDKDIYRRNSYIKDYNLSQMDKDDFCMIWINVI